MASVESIFFDIDHGILIQFCTKFQRTFDNPQNAIVQDGVISGDKVMDQEQKLKKKLAEIERKIKETEKRLPAHSVKPQIMTELFELEDEYEAVLAQLNALEGGQPASKE